MAEKNIKSRITHKHDVEANWLLAVNFTPKQGEIIIYDIDDNYTYERFKIGDGESNVNALPFAEIQADWNQNDENASDFIKNKPSLVGKNVEGTTYYINGVNITAGPHAEIFNSYENNKAAGAFSHAEGIGTTASGFFSHAEGEIVNALGKASHAEGCATTASGESSHTEGRETLAEGDFSHAEGRKARATGGFSHAEGYETLAYGEASHAEGSYTMASGAHQHVQGKYNIDDLYSLAHIVGNGSADDARSNAHTLDWDGNAWYAGDVYVGSTSGTNKDDGSKKLVTDAEVSTAIESLEQTINNKIDAMTTVIAIDDGEGNIELKPFLTHKDIIANILGGEY